MRGAFYHAHVWTREFAPEVPEANSALLAAGASGAPKRASGTLQLKATVQTTWDRVACPAGAPVLANCALFKGKGVVPGLGRATVTYTVIHDMTDPSCHPLDFSTAIIAVVGKGEIEASLRDPRRRCWGDPPGIYGPFEATILSGAGKYAGASGRGNAELRISLDSTGRGLSIDTWPGTLTVPGLDFDVTPPVIRGAISKTVRAPKNAKRVRARYAVTATDAVDGPVPVACTPRSGGFFRLGRTKVTCAATDSSGNTAATRFTVTVKRG